MSIKEAEPDIHTLNDFYRPAVSIETPREQFQSLAEFLEHGVKFCPTKRPYCIEVETKFAKLTHAIDGFNGKNLAGEDNIRRKYVHVFIGHEEIIQTVAMQKNESLYTTNYGVITGESNSLISIEEKLYVCSKIYSSDVGWTVQLARPTLFLNENVLDYHLERFFTSAIHLSDFVEKKISNFLISEWSFDSSTATC